MRCLVFAVALVSVMSGVGGLQSLAALADTYVNGIDVSVNNGTIDWSAVAGSGQKFAIGQAVDGNNVDDAQYAANHQGAVAHGIPFGAYNFARPAGSDAVAATQDAVAEADAFLNFANPAQSDLIPTLDLETTGGLSANLLIIWTRSWLQEVQRRLGVKAMIYTSPCFWTGNMQNTTEFANAGYPLWIAAYGYASWGDNPCGLIANNWGGHSWTFWQWGQESVPGITHPSQGTDADHFVGQLSDYTIRAQSSGAPPDGTFVTYLSNVYVIAGGAPVYVSNWGVYGGPQPTTDINSTQWAALNSVPHNGTFINAVDYTGAGQGSYVIAGGAPVYITNWSVYGGQQPLVTVDAWNLSNFGNPLDHLSSVPANGTFLNAIDSAGTGQGSYITAGGAPLYITSWSVYGGQQPLVTIDAWNLTHSSNPLDHLNSSPANGTFINALDTSGVGQGSYVVAGGAPIYVTNWSVYGGQQPVVNVDVWNLTHFGNVFDHLNLMPANGTFINAVDTSGSGHGSYIVAGGAPIYITSWSVYGGQQPVVNVDAWNLTNFANPLDHLRSAPADATFINALDTSGSGKGAYVVAGGAPIYISDWSIYGGPQPVVNVDVWNLTNFGKPLDHLSATPANGTIVRALPKQQFWSLTAGHRSLVCSGPSAIPVNDASLKTFTINLSIATCSLPAATKGTKYGAGVSALGGHSPYKWTISSGKLPNGLHLNQSRGRISGTPASTGTKSFTVKVTDSAKPKHNATRSLQIAVS